MPDPYDLHKGVLTAEEIGLVVQFTGRVLPPEGATLPRTYTGKLLGFSTHLSEVFLTLEGFSEEILVIGDGTVTVFPRPTLQETAKKIFANAEKQRQKEFEEQYPPTIVTVDGRKWPMYRVGDKDPTPEFYGDEKGEYCTAIGPEKKICTWFANHEHPQHVAGSTTGKVLAVWSALDSDNGL